EGLKQDELSLPPLRQPARLRKIERHAASPSLRTPRADGQDSVAANVQVTLRPHFEGGPIPPHLLHPFPYPVVAVIAGAHQERRHRDPLDLRVEELIEIRSPFCVRPVERFEGPAG